jgi:hypothetical protein
MVRPFGAGLWPIASFVPFCVWRLSVEADKDIWVANLADIDDLRFGQS